MIMKRINFNLKDRKLLMLFLCLVIVSVFTLTIAYAALNAVLNIQGNAEVAGSNWNIYLENAVVKNGSATMDVPKITSGKSLSFSTTLNMPGDFYEFTVDVVNNGSIDAMIENVIKTPELTTEQAKYLRYEVTYQNGESINAMQAIAAGSTMPIKVRIEYRNDLIASDLPTGQVVLDLSIILNYVQSDGSGSSVSNNGALLDINADGDINDFGTLVTIGSEQFYTIGTDGDNVKLLSKYNLLVGYYSDGEDYVLLENPTGIQDESTTSTSFFESGVGVVPYSSDEVHGNDYSSYDGSIVKGYVDSYKNFLEGMGVDVVEARLISREELTDYNTFNCEDFGSCYGGYSWLSTSAYWTGYIENSTTIFIISTWNTMPEMEYSSFSGVRPVIVISKDYFN